MGKAATGHNHAGAYSATGHAHAISDTTSLQASLDAKAPTHTHPYAATSHAHLDADIPAGIARDAEVTSAIATHAGTPHGGTLPAGLIVMWGGLVANIPSGWLLCDGLNGTPDLRDRFIRGAAAGQNPGAIGGAATHSHASTQPTAANESAHTHTVAGVPQHTHVMTASNTAGTSGASAVRGTGTQATITAPNPAGSVAPPLPTSAGSAHTHTISGGAVIDGSSLPPYYALCFIQKT